MLAAVLLGVGLIVFFEVRQQSSMSDSGLQGVMLGLVSGFFYAMVVLSVRALRDLDSAWLISLNLLVTAVVLLPYVLYLGVLPSFGQASWLVAFGAFQLGLPYVLFARGVRHMPSHQASFIVLLEPLLVPFWVWLAWRNDASYERPSWWTLVGGSMILVGLISRFGFDRSRSKSSS